MESLLVISQPDSGHRRAAGWDPKDSLAVFTCDVNRVHEKNRASSSRVHRCPALSNNILRSYGVTLRGNTAAIPVELGLGKVIQLDGGYTLNIYAEAQPSLYRSGVGAPN